MKGEPVKLLLDEHIWFGLAKALRDQGYDVIHISETSDRSIDDEPLLERAASGGRALLMYNQNIRR